MKKLIASIIVFAAPMAASVTVPAAAAHAAPAVEVNLGWCQAGLPSWQHPYLAPAKGNGPLVIVNERFVSTNGAAFDGYMGCSK